MQKVLDRKLREQGSKPISFCGKLEDFELIS